MVQRCYGRYLWPRPGSSNNIKVTAGTEYFPVKLVRVNNTLFGREFFTGSTEVWLNAEGTDTLPSTVAEDLKTVTFNVPVEGNGTITFYGTYLVDAE